MVATLEEQSGELWADCHVAVAQGIEQVLYKMGEGDTPASLEICGGPHVDHTGQLGEEGKKFKITKEEASSAGIRRIKAVLI